MCVNIVGCVCVLGALVEGLTEKIQSSPTRIRVQARSARNYIIRTKRRDFPDGPVVKNLPASAGDMGSIPGLGRSHMPQGN